MICSLLIVYRLTKYDGDASVTGNQRTLEKSMHFATNPSLPQGTTTTDISVSISQFNSEDEVQIGHNVTARVVDSEKGDLESGNYDDDGSNTSILPK